MVAGSSGALIVAIVAIAGTAQAPDAGLVGPSLLPWVVLMWCWGLLCTAFWFHPSRGTMRYGSRCWLGLPRPAQSFMRIYGAIFLIFWFTSSLLFLGFGLLWAAA